ncbi:hypothetical protein AAVH_01006 [Aphelenchoides avenae]|nr:hypothetical protein AAVH_01006 [Aphelenchus avenae]
MTVGPSNAVAHAEIQSPPGIAAGLEPEKVVCMMELRGKTHYLIQYKHTTCSDIVTAKDAVELCPTVICEYIMSHMS